MGPNEWIGTKLLGPKVDETYGKCDILTYVYFKLSYQRVMPQKGIAEKQVEGFCSFRLSVYIFVPPT